MQPLQHLDAAETIFFQRELEQILAEQYNERLAPMKSKLYVPINNSIHPGVEIVTYDQYKAMGEAKAVKSYSDDVPLVNVSGEQASQRMQSYADGFAYSIQELRAAAWAKKPLDRMRAEAARKVLDFKLDSILGAGDSAFGLKGLLSLSGTDTFTVPTKASGSTAWLTAGVITATSKEMYDDLCGIVSQVITNTKDTEHPSLILLPIANLEAIKNQRMADGTDTTVLNYFLDNHPGIRVESWDRCTGAGSGSTNRMVAYDPQLVNVQGLMAVEFEQMAPQLDNMAYKVICHMRTGGVISPYPKTICYGDGV
jgi:hypothetical protein